MPSRKIEFKAGYYYHIFNRWLNEQTIFYYEKDYQRFIESMKKYNEEYPWIKLLAWALLPNHFHFVLKSDESGLDISNYMRKVQQSYAMYFKTKYRRLSPDSFKKWPVFDWRFKAKLIDSEQYLEKVLIYVALNPVKHWIVDKIEDYKFTSYHWMDKALFKNVDISQINVLAELEW